MAGNSGPTGRRGKSKPGHEPTGGGGTPKGGESDPCDLFIDTDLESIRAAALPGISQGDQLTVGLDLSSPPFIAVVCKKADGTVVGSLAGIVSLSQLRTCLGNGIRYTVTVTSVGIGTCHVVGGHV